MGSFSYLVESAAERFGGNAVQIIAEGIRCGDSAGIGIGIPFDVKGGIVRTVQMFRTAPAPSLGADGLCFLDGSSKENRSGRAGWIQMDFVVRR